VTFNHHTFRTSPTVNNKPLSVPYHDKCFLVGDSDFLEHGIDLGHLFRVNVIDSSCGLRFLACSLHFLQGSCPCVLRSFDCRLSKQNVNVRGPLMVFRNYPFPALLAREIYALPLFSYCWFRLAWGCLTFTWPVKCTNLWAGLDNNANLNQAICIDLQSGVTRLCPAICQRQVCIQNLNFRL